MANLLKTMVLAAALSSAIGSTQAQVDIHFQKKGTNGGGYQCELTLTNTSGTSIDKDWNIYFSQLPTDMTVNGDKPMVSVRCVNGNFFELTPTEEWQPLQPGEQRCVGLRCNGAMNKVSFAPEGFFFVGADGNPHSLKCTVAPFDDKEYTIGVADNYNFNATLPTIKGKTGIARQLTPTVKNVTEKKGTCKLNKGFRIVADEASKSEARLLTEKLTSRYGLQTNDKGASIKLSVNGQLDTQNDEYYTLQINKKGIIIEGKTAHGVFNGTQTLLSLLRAESSALPCLTIEDWPDLPYRGVMLDIARNYTPYEQLLQTLDLLAEYKLNALHLHFADDEGWRIEIPGLPELTEVGGHRGYTTNEQDHLYPGYDGNWDATAKTTGNGFLTREQFISLLRFAAERHIQVMPEIESPGHARAAVVSMKARYNKYKDSDPQKATEYLLSDAADTSVYKSVQAYNDNVMNIAMPSTYAFMRKVITELAAMYAESGTPLVRLHLGGDEVAEGAWIGSPICQRFMAEKGMKTNEEMSSYFYEQNIRLLDSLGVKYAGWQEIVSAHKPLDKDYFREHIGAVNCWTTVPEWGTDELTYQMANKGYPVLLSNVTNCYMDMTYSRNPDERGLQWGGTVDESVAFSLLPFDGYRSVHHSVAGKPVNWAVRPQGKTQLTELGRKSILGVQGQLFAETIRGLENVEYCLFPKILGLLERGWHAHPSWEAVEGEQSEQLFRDELSQFYARLSEHEMPYWQQRGVNFHLPNPGMQVRDGMLYANTPIVDAEIRYTTDGTNPTQDSQLYTGPASIGNNTKAIKARLFKNGRESVVSVVIP